jgi:hypothetical protein
VSSATATSLPVDSTGAVGGVSTVRCNLEQLREPRLWDHGGAPESAHRQFAPGDEFVTKGPGKAEELTSFCDVQDRVPASRDVGDPGSAR